SRRAKHPRAGDSESVSVRIPFVVLAGSLRRCRERPPWRSAGPPPSGTTMRPWRPKPRSATEGVPYSRGTINAIPGRRFAEREGGRSRRRRRVPPRQSPPPAPTNGMTPAPRRLPMPMLTVDGVGTFEVPADKRLVLALEDEAGIDQLHACGGNARCTTCRVEFVSGEPDRMTQAEQDLLAARGLTGVRLSCQILCDRDMTVRAVSRLSGSGRDFAGNRPADSIWPQPVIWLAPGAESFLAPLRERLGDRLRTGY